MSKWTDEELAELEDPDMWDWDSAEGHPPVPNRKAQVVLDVAGAEFQRIAGCAARLGEPVTAFFLQAALERVAREESREHARAAAGGAGGE